MSYSQKKSCQAAIMRLIQEQLARATLHSARDSTINVLKIAGSALQNDVTYVGIASCFSWTSKNMTVMNSKSLKRLWYDNARPKGNLGSTRKIAGPSS